MNCRLLHNCLKQAVPSVFPAPLPTQSLHHLTLDKFSLCMCLI